MLKLKEQLVASRAKTSKGVNPCNYITIHETGNASKGANAQAHANLQTKGFTASWHYTVDDKEAIQSFPDTVRCWHAGDGAGMGNSSSIGIEICVNSDGDFQKAVDNAVLLTKQLMKKHGIATANVVQHNHWSGKNCPTNLRNGSKGVNWAQFKTALTKPEHVPQEVPTPTPTIVVSEKLFTVHNYTLDKAVQDVLYRLARREDQPLSDERRKDYVNGRMTQSEAIAILFLMIDRGQIPD